MKTLYTKRLILRPFKVSDLEDFFAYCSLPTVGPMAGWAVHTDKLFSLKIIESFIEKEDVLALEHKRDQKVIGSVGLHEKKDTSGQIFYEIGYVLSTPYEGQGLMTEAVTELIRHAFMDLQIDELFVCHFVENHKSRRVIEKCGFEYTHEADYKTRDFGTRRSSFYHLSKKDYIKQREDIF